jgi:hypothetical protein
VIEPEREEATPDDPPSPEKDTDAEDRQESSGAAVGVVVGSATDGQTKASTAEDTTAAVEQQHEKEPALEDSAEGQLMQPMGVEEATREALYRPVVIATANEGKEQEGLLS